MRMKIFAISIFSVLVIIVSADPANLQDLCPTARGDQSTFINGYLCKNPTKINAQDFKSTKLSVSGDTDNFLQSNVTLLTAMEFPGLNTLGLSVSRTDLEKDGSVLLHSHPRSSEMLFVVSGTVFAGFVDTKNKIFQTFLRKGDVIVFPKGLFHFVLNGGFERAICISFYNSQNPGVMNVRGLIGIDESLKKLLSLSYGVNKGFVVKESDEL